MFKFGKEDLLSYASIEDVEKYCNPYDLFRHYIGDFRLGKPIISPLLPEKEASFSVYAKGNKVLYNDFRLGGGDIITFVRKKFNLGFQEAINKIIYDSGLQDKFKTELTYSPSKIIKYDKVIVESKPVIKVKRRKHTQKDYDFWLQFGIGKESLIRFFVTPISHYFINNKIIKADTHAYCFTEYKDGDPSYTIYQPYNKKYKWFKSHDSSVFYGWDKLPDQGDMLIVTKSMKDVMTVDSCLKVPSVALQSEKTMPKDHVFEQLKDRFNHIYLLYDNDYDNEENGKPNYGRNFGKNLADKFGVTQIEISDVIAKTFDAKDISDLAKNAGVEYAKQLLTEPTLLTIY